MFNQNNPFNNYSNLRVRLRDRLLVELEGTLDTNSPQEMAMFEELFGELLEEENVKLSRGEKTRLLEALIMDIVDFGKK